MKHDPGQIKPDPENLPPALPERSRTWRALGWAVVAVAAIMLLIPLAQLGTAAHQEFPEWRNDGVIIDPPPVPPPPEPPKIDPDIDDPVLPPPAEDVVIQPISNPLDNAVGIPMLPKVPIIDHYRTDDPMDGILQWDQLDEAPRLVRAAPPPYPPAWERHAITGVVVVLMTVDSQGRVVDAKVESETEPGAAAVVTDTVRRWQFTPGTRNGRPVSFYVRQTFRFGD